MASLPWSTDRRVWYTALSYCDAADNTTVHREKPTVPIAPGIASPVFHPERWVGNRFSLAGGTSARRLETVPLPEHEPALPAFGRNLRQPSPLGTETFPKVFQVIRDLFFGPSDEGGDFLCRKRTFLQEGADLMPYGLRFLRVLARKTAVVPHAAAHAAAGRRAAPVASTVAMVPPLFRAALRMRLFPPDHLTLSRGTSQAVGR
jgi:hypothetical protein